MPDRAAGGDGCEIDLVDHRAQRHAHLDRLMVTLVLDGNRHDVDAAAPGGREQARRILKVAADQRRPRFIQTHAKSVRNLDV